MHILMMAQRYAPEEVSGAVLATELATDLVALGHRVTFVTSAPSYPKGEIFPGYHNRWWQLEVRDGVRVTRVWSYISPLKTFRRRVLNYGTFSASALCGGLLVGRPDVIFSYSPPLTLGVPAWILSRIWRVPWILRVEDLYPDAAVAVGVLKSLTAIKFFAWLERFLYQRADHISLISEGFRRNLLSKGVAGEKLSVTPVWADPNIVLPLPKENAFRKEHGLNGQFVVMYAGALGLTSALEDVMRSAEFLRDRADISFVIVGEGIKKATLMAAKDRSNLANVHFLPFQSRDRFAEMLAAADVSLVTLNRHSFNSSLPSKTFNIMASARPILAVTPEESEIAQLVQESHCGVNLPPEQPQLLATTILQLKDAGRQLEEMGCNGRRLLESRYSRQACVEAFVRVLERSRSE